MCVCICHNYIILCVSGYVTLHVPDAVEFVEVLRSSDLDLFLSDRILIYEENITRRFNNTPFRPWYAKGLVERYPPVGSKKRPHITPFYNQNIANALRLAIIYEEGGTYMDLDYFVKGNIMNLPFNTLTLYDDKGHINNSFLRFKPRHAFLKVAMKTFVRYFEPYKWGKQGPLLMDSTNRLCRRDRVCGWFLKKMTILPQETTSPVHFRDVSDLTIGETETSQKLQLTVRKSLLVHWWDHMLMKPRFNSTKVRAIDSTSLLYKLSAESCPLTKPFHDNLRK